MRHLINYLNNHFKQWKMYSIRNESEFTLKEMRLIYLVDSVMDITTYDEKLSIEFGQIILDVMRTILKSENFEYIGESKKNYVNFILVANLLEKCEMLEWGGSIRGCWFDEGKHIHFPGLVDVAFRIKKREEYDKLIDWFNGEDVKIKDEDEVSE